MKEKANLLKCLFVVSVLPVTLCLGAKGHIILKEVETKYGGGTGEPNNPYLIYTAEQLNEIGLFQLEWDKHYKLMEDIDLSCYTGEAFNIIGSAYNRSFTGVFDGNGHTISNFTYTSADKNYVGIFGIIENGEIKDLRLNDPNINTGNPWGQYIGSLAGYLSNSKIDNCHVSRGYVSGIYPVGGLVSRIYNSEIIDSSFEGSVYGSSEVGGIVGAIQSDLLMDRCSIIKCYFNGHVSGGSEVGGLVGILVGRYDVSISDCNVTANISGINKVGGLIGYQRRGITTNCAAAGSVSGTNEVGGFAGNIKGYIENCYTITDVSGIKDVGGFAGQNGVNYTDVVTPGYINNCYARGSVIGEENVGGFVGYNYYFGTIYNCYSTGDVSGTTEVGGLVGQNYQGDIIDSFWDTETSGLLISAGGTGKTTTEMKTTSTFIEWSACTEERYWKIDEGNDYPRLLWEDEPGEVIGIRLSDLLIGTGIENDPYLIYTAEELNSIGSAPCEWDKHFKLMADIDLSTYSGTEFNIIGVDRNNPFAGFFDGNNHIITNFNCTSVGMEYIGLFGFVFGYNPEIKNLRMINPNVNAKDGSYVGSLVGLLRRGTLTNCIVTGGNVLGESHVGGLVGQNGDGIGRMTDPNLLPIGIIKNCNSNVNTAGSTEVGGLVGCNSGNIVLCFSASTVTGTMYVGGLTGFNGATVANCYTCGKVIGEDTIGGFVGYNDFFGNIYNCYAIGSTSGLERVGGFVGYQHELKVRDGITKSFWDTETSGQTNSAGGIGKNTAEMQIESTFTDAGWDFAGETDNGTEDIWWIDEGRDYPRLWWQNAQSEE